MPAVHNKILRIFQVYYTNTKSDTAGKRVLARELKIKIKILSDGLITHHHNIFDK